MLIAGKVDDIVNVFNATLIQVEFNIDLVHLRLPISLAYLCGILELLWSTMIISKNDRTFDCPIICTDTNSQCYFVHLGFFYNSAFLPNPPSIYNVDYGEEQNKFNHKIAPSGDWPLWSSALLTLEMIKVQSLKWCMKQSLLQKSPAQHNLPGTVSRALVMIKRSWAQSHWGEYFGRIYFALLHQCWQDSTRIWQK